MQGVSSLRSTDLINSPFEGRAVRFSRRGKSGKPSPLRGEVRVRGVAVSAASALTPALSLKGEGELDSPALKGGVKSLSFPL